MALPTMTPEQRQAALEKAAASRKRRAAFVDAIPTRVENGSNAEELLNEALSDRTLSGMRAKRFLTAFPGIGKAKAERALEAAVVDERKRLSGMGPRQRETLCAQIDEMIGACGPED